MYAQPFKEKLSVLDREYVKAVNIFKAVNISSDLDLEYHVKMPSTKRK